MEEVKINGDQNEPRKGLGRIVFVNRCLSCARFHVVLLVFLFLRIFLRLAKQCTLADVKHINNNTRIIVIILIIILIILVAIPTTATKTINKKYKV